MSFKKLPFLKKLALKRNNRRGYQDYKLLRHLHTLHPVNLDLKKVDNLHFKHSGNSGDVIYALPAMYAIAENNPVHLFLNPDVDAGYGKNVYHPLGTVMLNAKVIDMLKPLMLYQSRIAGCDTLNGHNIDVDLDLIRSYPLLGGLGNITRWYFYLFAVNADLSIPWLEAPGNADYKDSIVIARSHRYRNPGINFGFLKKYQNLVFLGLPEEYEDIKKVLPGISYAPVKDFLEMASIIKSCKLFVGNQSFPFSIAEALKVKRVLEVCYYCPNVSVEGINGYDFCYQPQFEKIVERALATAAV
jgi:hypothetical protein